jgi:hypothetical protein
MSRAKTLQADVPVDVDPLPRSILCVVQDQFMPAGKCDQTFDQFLVIRLVPSPLTAKAVYVNSNP